MKESKESVVVPVILCGGSGTRLWPASRESYPKQFLSLMGGDFSMLQNTVKRALRAADASVENVVTVTLGSLESQVRNQLSEIDPAAARHVLCEPSARNTAAAVALAAEYVRKNFGAESIMWILPADHHIGNENDLALSLGYALKAARDGYLVTFGIRPTRPDTGYGYILLGDHLAAGNVCKAQKFVEKPNREVAQGYLDAGNYLWNSGMFLFETGAVLSEYRKHADAIHADVQAAMKAAASAASPDADLYGQIAKEPFDVAIMEKSEHVAIVPCDPEWSDIGSWESLWEIRQKDGNGNVIDGRAACHDTKNCLIQTKDLLVACAGLENIVVVETGDAILIANRSNSDAMKTIVGGLRKMGAREVIDVPPSPKAWSMTKTVDGESGYSVHEIVIRPGEKLALDAHSYPSKFWTVVDGHAEVTIGNESKSLAVHETAFIPVGVGYSVSNMTASELKIVEVNRGEQAQSRLRIFAPSARTEAA